MLIQFKNEDNSIRQKSNFSLTHTKISRGIACATLLYRHLFYSASAYYKWPNNLIFNRTNFRSQFAVYCRICTGIYAFISGIGLFYSLVKIKNLYLMYRKVLNHLIRLMLNFYCILLLVYPIGVKTKILFDLKLSTLINSITVTHNHGHWWYLRMYFVLSIYAPLIILLFQHINYKKKIFPWLIFYLLYIISKIYLDKHNGFYLTIIKKYFIYFTKFDVIIIFFVGILCAKLEIINLFMKGNIKEQVSFSLFTIFTSIFIRVLLVENSGEMRYDFFCVPLFILPISNLIKKNKILEYLFCFIGRHSTNIWLIHGYFQIFFFTKILYIFKFGILLFIWNLILCIFSSYIVLIFYIPLDNIICGKK